jgi:hypothetical protein
MTLTIDPEFRDLIPPITAEERSVLEASVASEGCREDLIAWGDILIDGHNRYEICTKLHLPFKVHRMDFAGRDDAKVWIIRNQLGRRNLQPAQRIALVIVLEPLLSAAADKRMKSGKSNPMDNCPQGATRDSLAQLANVSGKSVERFKRVEASPVKELGRYMKTGKVSIDAAATVAKLPESEQEKVVQAGPDAVKEKAAEMRKQKNTPAPSKAKNTERERGKDAADVIKKEKLMTPEFRIAFETFEKQIIVEKRRGYSAGTSIEAARACVRYLVGILES